MCKIDKIGPESVTFRMIRQKVAYPSEYARKCCTDLYQIFNVDRYMDGND